MSKKQVAQNQDAQQVTEEVVAENDQNITTAVAEEAKKETETKNAKKTEKSKEKDKKKKKKDKKSGGGIVKKTRETVSELKKVTWPSFGEVVKKTGIVIAFVVLFGLFFYGVNALFGWLVTLLC